MCVEHGKRVCRGDSRPARMVSDRPRLAALRRGAGPTTDLDSHGTSRRVPSAPKPH
jgi:hypothetical protein